MEVPLQTEMVELVPNGKHLEGLLPVSTSTAGNQRYVEKGLVVAWIVHGKGRAQDSN